MRIGEKRHPTTTNIVLARTSNSGYMSPSAMLLYITETVNKIEIMAKKHFVGRTQKIDLDNVLRHAAVADHYKLLPGVKPGTKISYSKLNKHQVELLGYEDNGKPRYMDFDVALAGFVFHVFEMEFHIPPCDCLEPKSVPQTQSIKDGLGRPQPVRR